MGWSIGYDSKWGRDIGYGVPATCDQPGCGVEINRGINYVCGEAPYGGDDGCGLFFCGDHKLLIYCERCEVAINHITGDPLDDVPPLDPFKATPDTTEWAQWKLTHHSWQGWREDNPLEVEKMRGANGEH